MDNDNGVVLLDDQVYFAGSDEPLFFNVYQTNKNPIDLGGSVVTWSLSPFSRKYAGAILVKQGQIVPNTSANNQVRIDLLSEDTVQFLGKYIQQLEILDADNQHSVLAQGNITFIRNINV